MAKTQAPAKQPEQSGTAVAKAPNTFAGFLDSMKPKIAAILPKHLTPERMLMLANLVTVKTPKLRECTPASVFNAIVAASRLGLEIGRHAHLVPFGKECVFIPDYQGLIHLAVSSGKVRHIDARVVYRDDHFDYELGTEPRIVHRPKLGGGRDPKADIIAFYAVGHLTDGSTVIGEPMTKHEMDLVKARSRAGTDGPWVTDYAAMGRKTVVKRLCKFLPQTPELAAAIELDNRADSGEVGMVSELIDTNESLNADVADKTKEKAEELKKRMGAQPAEAAEGESAPEPEGGAQGSGKDGDLPF